MPVLAHPTIRHTGPVCGLLAYLRDPSADPSTGLVDAVSGAAHLMRHRGPDEPGTWADDDAEHVSALLCRPTLLVNPT